MTTRFLFHFHCLNQTLSKNQREKILKNKRKLEKMLKVANGLLMACLLLLCACELSIQQQQQQQQQRPSGEIEPPVELFQSNNQTITVPDNETKPGKPQNEQKPEGNPESFRPEGMRPQGKPEGRPEGNQGFKPEGRPGGKPEGFKSKGMRPQEKPERGHKPHHPIGDEKRPCQEENSDEKSSDESSFDESDHEKKHQEKRSKFQNLFSKESKKHPQRDNDHEREEIAMERGSSKRSGKLRDKSQDVDIIKLELNL